MSGDDWRGLDKIRIPIKSAAERKSETYAISSKLAHGRRRAAGCSMAQSGGMWARQIRSWHLSGKLKDPQA